MDDQTRDDLLTKLSHAKKRKAQAVQQLHAHADRIEQVREDLGNPYFYSGRSADDRKSEARFSNCKSLEPALRLYRGWQEMCREVVEIQKRLREAGVGS